MGIVIGIDVGGSTTKIVGVEDKKIKNPMFVKATDPVTSLFGAFGKYIYDNNISLSNIEKVILTGVGSAYIDQPLYGLPTAKTDEFLANGLGAQYNTGLDSCWWSAWERVPLLSRYKAPRSSISGDWVSVAEPSSACLSYY